MAIEFRCTKCTRLLQTGNDTAGKQARCPRCGTVLSIPAPQPGVPDETQPYAPPPSAEPGSPPTEDCPFCAEPISAHAVKCKHCGSMLDAGWGQLPEPPDAPYPPGGVVTPVLISAVSNVVMALFWLCLCVTAPLAILFGALCIAEFRLHGKAAVLSPADLAARAKTLGILEIIVGLLLGNLVALVCGIVVLANLGKLRPQPEMVVSYS